MPTGNVFWSVIFAKTKNFFFFFFEGGGITLKFRSQYIFAKTNDQKTQKLAAQMFLMDSSLVVVQEANVLFRNYKPLAKY